MEMFLELHAVIHFLCLKRTRNQAIPSELEELYGKDMIWLRAVEKRTPAFTGGCTEFADLPRSGKPHDTGKVGAVRALIEGEGYVSQKKIAQILGVHQETVERNLRDDLNMRKVNFKWVPHALDNSQKGARVHVSRKLLDFLESGADRSLSNIYTGDETSMYLDNPRTSMQIEADITRPIRVRRTVTSKKRPFRIDFSRTGIGIGIRIRATSKAKL
jgi:hypothetical protein